MVKKTSRLEDYIKRLLHHIDIYHPHQLDIETISSRLGVTVIYWPYPAMRVGKVISLDSRASLAKQWQSFSHELCHVLWHYGSQLNMPMSWEAYQEMKANNFANHFCIPSFMLNNMKFTEYDRDHVWRIEEEFMVEKEFARKRWEQHVRNLISC